MALRLLWLLLVMVAGAFPAEGAGGMSLIWAEPNLRRVEVEPGKTAVVTVLVHSLSSGQILAATTDCRCVEVTTVCPMSVTPDRPARLDLRVHGLLPGLKTVTVRTTLGSASITLQVVSAGLGTGATVLRALPPVPAGGRRWILVHDLGEALRNCGCTGGSLGGVDRIAGLGRALPGSVKVLTGTVGEDARRILTPEGWVVGHPGILVQPPEVASALNSPGVVAVLAAQGPEHQRRIPLPPSGGIVAIILDMDAQGRLQAHHVVPIDATILAVPEITATIPRTRTVAVVEDATAGMAACQTCHAEAVRVWSVSGHGRPWAGLPPQERVDDCLPCHITPRPEQTALAGVSCTACHVGADAHARQPMAKPPSPRSCRECHDAKHDPAFDQDRAWKRIKH